MPDSSDSGGGPKRSSGGASESSLTGPHLWHIRWVRDLALIGFCVFLLWFGFKLRSIFTPVLVGLFLAYFLHPLITWAERKKVPRPASISVILLLLLGAMGGVGLWLGPKLAGQSVEMASTLADQIETLAERLEPEPDGGDGGPGGGDGASVGGGNTEDAAEDARAGGTFAGISEGLNRFADKYREDPASAMIDAIRALFAGGKTAGSWIGSVLGTATYVAVSLALIPIYFFFFAWHFSPIVRGLESYIPQRRRERVLHVLGRMDTAVASFFRSRLLISLIMAVMLGIGWWAIGVPYAFVLGLLGGLLSMIPYVGMIIWPVAIMLKWLDMIGAGGAGFSLWMIFIWPSVVYLIVQAVETWLLTPWIQGKQLEMSPVTILIVVFIGGAIGGLYGLILSLPVAACLKIFLEEVVLPRIRQWAVTH